MKNVSLVARPVCYAPTTSICVYVLTVENVPAQAIQVDPALPLNHKARRENPPRITHVSKFVWSAIKATLGCLSLTQPET